MFHSLFPQLQELQQKEPQIVVTAEMVKVIAERAREEGKREDTLPQNSPWDMKRLLKLIVMSGTYRQSSGATREQMERDPETYLVSAEAHNQWRGSIPYYSYPMRRIGSVNLFSRA